MNTLNPKLFKLTPSNLERIKNTLNEIEEKIRHFEYDGEEKNSAKIERLVDRKDSIDLALHAYFGETLTEKEARLLISLL